MKKLNLGKLKLAPNDILKRNQLAGIYGGSGSGPSDYCTSLFVVRSCNTMNQGSHTGWNYGWAAGSCNNNGMSGEFYYHSAINSGYDLSSCTNFGWI